MTNHIFKMKKFFLIVTAFISLQQAAFAQTLQDGVKLLNNEKYKAAVSFFENYAKTNATDLDALFYLGNVYCKVGRYDEALATYQKITVANPKSQLGNLGAAKVATYKENAAEAKRLIDAALKATKTKDLRTITEAGAAYIVGKKPNATEAVAILTKGIALGKKDAALYETLGDAYLVLNDGGKSVTNYEYAAEYDKTNPVLHYKIGNVYYRALNNNKVVEHYNKAKELDPKFAPVYREAGDFYLELNDYTKARDNYAKYIELGETSIEDQMLYANTLFLSEDYTGTINKVNEIVKIDSSKNYLLRLLGYCYYETGDSVKALDFMEKFLTKTDRKKIVYSDYTYYAKSLAKNNKIDQAISAYQIAISIADTAKDFKTEKKLSIYNDVGDLCYEKDRYEDAVKFYKLRIEKSEAPDVNAYYDLARAYYWGKNYAEADKVFAKIIELRPDLVLGYAWQVKTQKKLEIKGSGAAKPYCEKLIQVITTQPDNMSKYQKELVDAYSYLADYYVARNDFANARANAQKGLAIDNANKYLNEVLKSAGQ